MSVSAIGFILAFAITFPLFLLFGLWAAVPIAVVIAVMWLGLFSYSRRHPVERASHAPR